MKTIYFIEPVPGGWMCASNDPDIRNIVDGYGFSLDKLPYVLNVILYNHDEVVIRKADTIENVMKKYD